ncbi:MAG: anthranilate phosphoribosyltransferase [SAR202 cluster bacterium]|nr:anthranilate phosphoribosyltransferase [SAR202 cluster bacterium]
MAIRDAIEVLARGESLSMDVAAKAMSEIMAGEATPAQFGAFVTALRMKGETPEEIAGMARVMREKSLHVHVDGLLVDTCGTGGDRSGTFNVSTTAGLVVAGSGVKVAKHGNRAMSGASGSADVLEALGVKIDLSPEGVQRCLEETGFGFMFAQRFHPSMKFAAAPRREIGVRTVFNILGPLTNPAGATLQLIGVADPAIAPKIAEVLRLLGSRHALVVHGEDGMDEVTLSGATRVWELKGGKVAEYRITPEDLGVQRAPRETLWAADAKASAATARAVLDGVKGPARDIVLMNAAAALLAADRATTLKVGVALASQSIDGGKAKLVLDTLVRLSQALQ